MKKFAALSLSLMMMITNVFAADVTVKLNNEEVSFAAQQPVIVEGRTLIPLRSIFESLGYTIEWQADTKTAVLKSENAVVTITANADSFDVDGNVIALDTPAQILNGSMMLPLRAIGEASGLSVGWDNETKVVTLESKAAEPVNNSVAVGTEMQQFFDNLKSYEKIDYYLMDITYNSLSNDFDIIDGLSQKTLAYTKASEKISALNSYYDAIYKQADTFKVSEDYKTAKGTLLDIINVFKKAAEYDKNYYDGIYADDDAYMEDIEGIFEQMTAYNDSLDSELARLNNKYMQTMYKYFDTEKDTEENKTAISEFVEKLGKIDAEYPMPTYEDIYDDDGNYITDNFDKNIETIRKAAEGRKTAFQAIDAPANCKERLELIICSNEVLENMADAFESYKAYGSEEYNPYMVEIEYNIGLYDTISTLAADTKLKRINIEDEEEYDFETHTDDNYDTIETEGISNETQDFVNQYYYLNAVNWYIEENNILNNFYGFLMNFDDTTASTKNIKEFFTAWKESQNRILNNLKSFTVNEALMAAKSAAINFITIDINYTAELEKIYAKTYSESQFDVISEEINKKLEAANDNYNGEISRINTLLDNYVYEYCDPDAARTENSEIMEFGKAVEEINKKYPIKDDINVVYGVSVSGSIYVLDDSEIKSIKARADSVIANIANREAEYKNLEVPDSCEKRLELIYAADKLVIEHANLCKSLKANDEEGSFDFRFSQNNLWETYDTLIYLATGGEAELLYPGYDSSEE